MGFKWLFRGGNAWMGLRLHVVYAILLYSASSSLRSAVWWPSCKGSYCERSLCGSQGDMLQMARWYLSYEVSYMSGWDRG